MSSELDREDASNDGGFTVTFEGGTETRKCPECGIIVKTPEETPYVWCQCDPKGVPMVPKDGDNDA